ncbi:MAG: MarR family transcriptional regulator [Planctomycetaceae bacterium]|nr:MarR family transcriptional regulator [Planctomycetaceae bacterium]
MSNRGSSTLSNALLERLAEVCARQWYALGGLHSGKSKAPCRSVVDPEALVLSSILALDADPRLGERLAWWSRTGARSTSVQRIRTMAESLPEPWNTSWRAFAAEAGVRGTPRWQVHGQVSDPVVIRERRSAEPTTISVHDPAALMLRLRLAFGVNARADLLAYLLTSPEVPASSADAARELAYSESTIKRAARDMAAAGLVREAKGHPVVYSATPAWRDLLRLDRETAPVWLPWARLCAWMANTVAWERETHELSPYVRASHARDVFEAHLATLRRLPVEPPQPARHPGEAFESAYRNFALRLADDLVASA